MTVTPLGQNQDCSLKIREPEVPALFGSWILEVGARPPWLACTSSSLESVPCPFTQDHQPRDGTIYINHQSRKEEMVTPDGKTTNEYDAGLVTVCGKFGLLRSGSAPAKSHNKHSIELEAQTFPGHFGLLMPSNQQARKGITLSGVIGPDYHGEIGLHLHSGVNGKLQQTNSDRMTKGTDSSEMKRDQLLDALVVTARVALSSFCHTYEKSNCLNLSDFESVLTGVTKELRKDRHTDTGKGRGKSRRYTEKERKIARKSKNEPWLYIKKIQEKILHYNKERENIHIQQQKSTLRLSYLIYQTLAENLTDTILSFEKPQTSEPSQLSSDGSQPQQKE
ncbi:hypothetical protein STEG23_034744, partial [Scotinomys teguina]